MTQAQNLRAKFFCFQSLYDQLNIIMSQKYIQVMSKVNVRFIYSDQPRQGVINVQVKLVNSTHQGPINLSNLCEMYARPSYHEIGRNGNANHQQNRLQQNATSLLREIPVVNSVEVDSKPTSPKFSQARLKSPNSVASEQAFIDQLKTTKIKRNQSPRPVVNIDQVNESQFVAKKQSKKNIQKESQFLIKKQSKKNIQQEPADIPEGQVVLKAPSFKFIPKQEGELNSGNRKEYVRAEKAEKYLYNGIPLKSEDDFIGCFGCFQKKPQTFKAKNK